MATSASTSCDATRNQLPVTYRIALLAIFSALGIALRQVVVPTWSPFVTLTPGFTMPLLTGLVLGPVEGIACGAVVGLSGGIWEPLILPLLGNIALGLSTGVPSLIRHRLPKPIWATVCTISAIFIGGFLPTFAVETFFGIVPIAAIMDASLDALQAYIWVVIALILFSSIAQPMLQRLRVRTLRTEW